jgi:UDP-perosamine 4-acetyltransferase
MISLNLKSFPNNGVSILIINTGAKIDHECHLGRGVHLAPGTLLAGRVNVEEGAFLGAGTVTRDKIRIGAWSVIGAGSLVIDDIPAGITAHGRPARVADH